MPPPADPMMMDPMMAPPPMMGEEPVASDAMLAMMQLMAQMNRPPGPDPANWDRLGGKPKRPKAAEVVERAQQDREWHSDWLDLLAMCDDFIEMRVHGRFNRDADALTSGEIERYFDPTIHNEHYKGVEELSSYEIYWEAPTNEFIDNEESRAKAAFLTYVFECWERQHDADGMGDLRASLADDAMRKGVLASAHVVDPDSETGIRSMIYDAANVYPNIEIGRGLTSVTCCYRARADEVIAKYGNDPAIARKLRKIAKDGRDDYDPSYEFDMSELWNRNWVVVCADEVEVYAEEHGRQEVPFVLTYNNLGKQRHTNRSNAEGAFRAGARLSTEFGISSTSTTRRDERAFESLPFCYGRLKSHIHKEAVGTHLTTHVRDAYSPAMVWQRSLQDRKLTGAIEVDYGMGGQTEVGADAKFGPLKDLNQLGLALQPLSAMIAQNDATSGLPPVSYGIMPGSQTSGTAAKEMAVKGMSIYRPVARHEARHLAACGEMWLRIWANYGDTLGRLDNPGVLMVPQLHQRGGSGGAHKVTKELIDRTGTRVKCELKNGDVLGDPGRMNAAMMAMNTGFLDEWSLRQAIGADPELVQERIMRQQLRQVPEVGQRDTLNLLLKDIAAAAERGDEQSKEQAIRDAQWITEQMFINQMAKMGMAQAMERAGMGPADPAEAAGPPVGPDGAPMLPGQLPTMPPGMEDGAPSGANFQGASMPEFGIDTGVQGGRPMAMNPGEV